MPRGLRIKAAAASDKLLFEVLRRADAEAEPRRLVGWLVG